MKFKLSNNYQVVVEEVESKSFDPQKMYKVIQTGDKEEVSVGEIVIIDPEDSFSFSFNGKEYIVVDINKIVIKIV